MGRAPGATHGTVLIQGDEPKADKSYSSMLADARQEIASMQKNEWKRPLPLVIDTAIYTQHVAANPQLSNVYATLIKEGLLAVSSTGPRMGRAPGATHGTVLIQGDDKSPDPKLVDLTKRRLGDIKAAADKGDAGAKMKWSVSNTNYTNKKALAAKGDPKATAIVAVLEATGLFKS